MFWFMLKYLWSDKVSESCHYSVHVCSEIRSRFNQKLVMTVSFPTDLIVRGDSKPQPLAGCAITLQSRRVNLFGHAHQRWRYDAETGFITAFNTDLPDKGEGWLCRVAGLKISGLSHQRNWTAGYKHISHIRVGNITSRFKINLLFCQRN